MTARQPAKRPVVRVTFEMYPMVCDRQDLDTLHGVVRDAVKSLHDHGLDYRRPRVVSVKAVRGSKR